MKLHVTAVAKIQRTAKVLSLKNLNSLLKEGFISEPLTIENCETYGRKTMAYVFKPAKPRAELEKFLKSNQVTFNPEYWPGSQAVEIQVRYLKAEGWDE